MNISRRQRRKPLIHRSDAGVDSINPIDYENNCQRLTRILRAVLDIYKNRHLGNKELYAHNLAHTFLNHVYAVLVLIEHEQKTNLPYLPVEISMLPSIQVLVRASFEAYLTFYHIFIDPQTIEQRNFRYLRYVYSGYFERGKIELSDDIVIRDREIATKDREIASRLRRQLRANNIFQTLGSRQQEKILDGNWRLETWTDIGLKAGFSRQISIIFYKYLCGYAHSGSLSVRQSSQVLSKGQQFRSIDSLIVLLNICIAKMIEAYRVIFIETETCLSEEVKGFITLWARQAG